LINNSWLWGFDIKSQHHVGLSSLIYILLAVVLAPASGISQTHTTPLEIGTYKGHKSTLSRTGSGYFRVEKVNNTWWFITPDGHLMFVNGVDVFEGPANDIRMLVLKSVTNAVRKSLDPKTRKAFTVTVPFIMPDQDLPDVFSKDFEKTADTAAKAEAEKWRDDSWLLGYFLSLGNGDFQNLREDPQHDNKTPVSVMAIPDGFWPVVILRQQGRTAGKQAFAELMAKRYQGKIYQFNARYSTNFHRFQSMEQADFTNIIEHLVSKRDDIEAFLVSIAETYFKVTTQAIRRHDPHHLVLGCRLNGDPPEQRTDEMITVAGRYCDVISGDFHIQDAASGDFCLARWKRWHALTKRPLLISAFTVPAQDQQAIWPLERAANVPFVLGYYLESPKGGKNHMSVSASLLAQASSANIPRHLDARFLEDPPAELAYCVPETPKIKIAKKKPAAKQDAKKNPTLLGVHALFMRDDLVFQIKAKVARVPISGKDMARWLSNSRLKSRQIARMQQYRNRGVQVVITVRWPNTESEKRSGEGKPHGDRVPVDKDREECLALLSRFLETFGPHMDWYALQNEPVDGNGVYEDHNKKNASGESPAVDWLVTLATHVRKLQEKNPALTHLKLLSPAFTKITRLAEEKKVGQVDQWFIDQLIEMSNKHLDAVDVHMHNVATVAQSKGVIDWLQEKTKLPIVVTEWSPAELGKDWLNKPVADERFGKDITNEKFIQKAYKKPVSNELWNAFTATVPVDVHVFMEEQFAMFNQEGLLFVCYGAGQQIGKPYYDWKQLFATQTVDGDYMPNQMCYDAFVALSSKYNSP